MIVVDVNLLVYAYDSSAAQHRAARTWWEDVLSAAVPVGIPWIVVVAFTRLMTHPTLSANPMTINQVRDAVEAWLACDHVRLLVPNAETFGIFFDLLGAAGQGGNLTTDAMIAALAAEYGGRVFSNDHDFGRFPQITWINPLASPPSR